MRIAWLVAAALGTCIGPAVAQGRGASAGAASRPAAPAAPAAAATPVAAWPAQLEAFLAGDGADLSPIAPILAGWRGLDRSDPGARVAAGELARVARAAADRLAPSGLAAGLSPSTGGEGRSARGLALALRLSLLESVFAAELEEHQLPRVQAAAERARGVLSGPQLDALTGRMLRQAGVLLETLPALLEVLSEAAPATVPSATTALGEARSPRYRLLPAPSREARAPRPEPELGPVERVAANRTVAGRLLDAFGSSSPASPERVEPLLAPAAVTTLRDVEGERRYRGEQGHRSALEEWAHRFSRGADSQFELTAVTPAYAVARLRGTLELRRPVDGVTSVAEDRHVVVATLAFDERGRVAEVGLATTLLGPLNERSLEARAKRARGALLLLGAVSLYYGIAAGLGWLVFFEVKALASWAAHSPAAAAAAAGLVAALYARSRAGWNRREDKRHRREAAE